MKLQFCAGTLMLDNPAAVVLPTAAAVFFRPDQRTGNLRARGCDYAGIVLALRMAGINFQDEARQFRPLDQLKLRVPIRPRPHQSAALEAWRNAGYRGIAALPTGSGKTILAVMAIAALKRPAIILAPTIDLVVQWVSTLERFFNLPIGMLGGGEHRIEEITVSTYDSAQIHMENLGNRFAFLIADECHHLPGQETRLAAAMSIAPYRLGLSATPELPDDRMAVLEDLLGPVVHRVHIDELEGKILSPYVVRRIRLELDPEERCAYRENRTIYLNFLRSHGIYFSSPNGWGRFLMLAGRSPEGRRAFAAFLEQRRIARGGAAKLRMLWELRCRHAGEQMIVFTADNATAYDIGRRFVWPVLTCRTSAAERKEFLDRFRDGTYQVIVTSRVLNEGVDVPEASVAVVLSGSGSVREHVQRLGRILRAAPGKEQAVLYELISADTNEEATSERRRGHRAYSRH